MDTRNATEHHLLPHTAGKKELCKEKTATEIGCLKVLAIRGNTVGLMRKQKIYKPI